MWVFLYSLLVMKTLKQQIEDALWYLERPGQTEDDETKAIEILATIARGKKNGEKLVKAIQESETPNERLHKTPWLSLEGLEIAVVPGHEPGGGAQGERTYNKKVGRFMKAILELHGAKVFYYEHKLKSYGARQRAMKKAVKGALPDCFIVFELHYDGYGKPVPSGHHFKYRGAKELAVFTNEEFENRFPQSRARYDNGLHHCTSGDGSGFLRESPGWAILTEPFFITNPAEKVFFKGREEEIAEIYCVAAARFAKFKGK